MDVREALRTRRTVHQFRAGSLPDGALERALEAALQAPNHRLTEPWRFVRVGPETRHALLELGIALATGGSWSTLGPAAQARLEATVLNPAELLVVSQVLHAELAVRQEDFAAVACAVQNMSLSLWSEGIGSKWSTEALTEHPRVHAALGIDPERERIVGFFWAGLAAQPEPSKPRRRKSIEHVLRVLP
jgi:nitroreductase